MYIQIRTHTCAWHIHVLDTAASVLLSISFSLSIHTYINTHVNMYQNLHIYRFFKSKLWLSSMMVSASRYLYCTRVKLQRALRSQLHLIFSWWNLSWRLERSCRPWIGMHVCLCVFVNVCIYIHLHLICFQLSHCRPGTCVNVCLWICVRPKLLIHMHTHTYTHAYIHTHIHTYTHACIHIYIYALQMSSYRTKESGLVHYVLPSQDHWGAYAFVQKVCAMCHVHV